jgi:hypothetical protein
VATLRESSASQLVGRALAKATRLQGDVMTRVSLRARSKLMSAGGLSRYLPCGLAVALEHILLLYASRSVRAWERGRLQANFDERGAALARGLQDDLGNNANVAKLPGPSELVYA